VAEDYQLALFMVKMSILSGVLAIVICSAGRAADAPNPSDVSKSLATVEQILRQAGASSSDIAWVNENLLSTITPEAIAGYAESLMLQSPDELAKTLKEIKLDSQYTLGPDSQQHEGVPQGKIQEFTPVEWRIFPGFEHRWWLYIPAQYTGGNSVPIMIFLDGESWMRRDGHWRAPVVLDNLIARKEVPIMAAVFVDPGAAIAKYKGTPIRDNRSEEYDTLSGAYASLILDEILPEVGRHVRVTRDPAGRGIAGCSSGGIGAFTVAWQRPDQFRKVISFSGSFWDERGGQVYPTLIRKENRRPIRVFQHVGANDLVLDGLPSTFEENNLMSAALDGKHYDHKYIVDQGTHCSVGAASILPDAMRWTWRDFRP
jgi:enterochelin esterase family protein